MSVGDGQQPVDSMRRAPQFSEMMTRFARSLRFSRSDTNEFGDIATLVRIHRKRHKHVDLDGVRRAYEIAERFHRGQMRKSGEPYITHPVAVATILAQLGMDSVTIMAALLHDTVEDTRYTLANLHNDFGDEVAHLVDGVTKLEKVHFGGAVEAETTRKMLLAAGRDVRVLLIKLADRLHNMRTLGAKSSASRIRIATVTRDILVPLAGRLGVQVIKRELEDLVLAALDPQAYADVDSKVVVRTRERQKQVAAVMRQLVTEFRTERLPVRILDRPRHYTSIYERQVEAGMPEHLCDDPRVVIVVRGESADCYAVLGVVHGKWRPVPGRFKDFIATPKFNLYKSLHTTIIGPDTRPLDVMIRTEQMHEVAEYGIAAHHIAQAHSSGGQCQGCWAGESAELDWLQRLVDWQHDAASGSFLESLRYGLADHEIVVFVGTEAVSLPSNSTPVDVAYALDTSIGDRCVGARVNGALAPLSSPLSDGDSVEILSAPSGYAGPEREWLSTVRTPHARSQIERWFADQDSSAESDGDERKKGRDAVGAALMARGRFLANKQPLVSVARSFGYIDVDALYSAVSRSQLSADEVADRLINMVDGASAAL